ncbi:MAG: hypothetical protein LBR79_05775 [Oscillospiraceae bacterium]|nr:hypothetical protein [Oscillospiraceae bacterium]
MLLAFFPRHRRGKKQKSHCFKKIFIINSDATYVSPAIGGGKIKNATALKKFLL